MENNIQDSNDVTGSAHAHSSPSHHSEAEETIAQAANKTDDQQEKISNK